MLKLSKRTVCNLLVKDTNPLPALRVGRSVRFRRCDVRRGWKSWQTVRPRESKQQVTRE
jgi:hypothetical protein